MVGVIDYGMGNLNSVANAVKLLGFDVKICSRPEDLLLVERIILPGVGAFRDCMDNLRSKGFLEALDLNVIKKRKPILGICLGMQVMARKGFEGKESDGLGWIDADVVRMDPVDKSYRIPHIGWNNISYKPSSPIFKGLPISPDVYFVHSYYMKCASESDIEATVSYSGIFTSAIRKSNIFGVQFHPEKSQDMGLVILKNFLNWNF